MRENKNTHAKTAWERFCNRAIFSHPDYDRRRRNLTCSAESTCSLMIDCEIDRAKREVNSVRGLYHRYGITPIPKDCIKNIDNKKRQL